MVFSRKIEVIISPMKHDSKKLFTIVISVLSGRDRLSRSTRKVFISQFLAILAVCVITIAVCFSFFVNSMLKADAGNRQKAYDMTLKTISDSLDTLMSACLDDTIMSVRNSSTLTHMSLLASEPIFYGMTFTRAKNDLMASISGIGVFSEAFIYIPDADICVSSSGVTGNLYSISKTQRSIITDYLDGRAVFSMMKNSLFEYTYYRCDSELVICHNVYEHDGKPLSILFLTLDMANITAFLDEIIATENPDISICIKDHTGFTIYGTDDQEEKNIIIRSPEFLGWDFSMVLSDNTILESTSIGLSNSIVFSIILVLVVAFVNLIVTGYIFRPMYNVTEVLNQTGIAAESPSEAIGKISSYQNEISVALKTISTNVGSSGFLLVKREKRKK